MSSFMNDFTVFTTAIFSTIRNFINNFFTNTVLGEIFLFVIVSGIFISIILWIIALGRNQWLILNLFKLSLDTVTD